jgi:hypothetical protein
VSGEGWLRRPTRSLALLAWLVAGAIQTQAQLTIDWFTVGDPGATSDGGNYSLSGTIGQADAGEMSGGNYALTGGFWSLYSLPDTSSGIEGDVSPRAQANGVVSVTDWVQVGRFVAGLDAASVGAEFQRADCAPRATLGDGRLTVSDWVQAGRYAAGLDAATAAGGPTSAVAAPAGAFASSPSALARQATAARTLALRTSAGANRIAVTLDSAGGENALGFSVGFDPTVYRYQAARLSQNAEAATLLVNPTFAEAGRIGFALALPPGQTLGAGLKELVEVEVVPVGAEGERAAVRFLKEPLQLEVVDVEAQQLFGHWIDDATIVVGVDGSDADPAAVWRRSGLSLHTDGGALTISWSSDPGGGVLETSSSVGPGAIWTPVTSVPQVLGKTNAVKIEATNVTRFYRLRRQ